MEFGLVAVWLIAYLGLYALGLPVAAALVPDRGAAAGVAVPASLATIGLIAYWVGQAAFGYVALVAGLATVGAAAGVALARGIRPDRRRAAGTAAVFVLAFAFMIAIRAMDPAVHPGGGEKFLDFGMLKALLRAPTVPPEDFWFAGEPVNYYYGGHMLAALLAELTGTPGRYAYNLALAGYYATYVAAAYGLAGAVGVRVGGSRRTAGALGAFFVGLASNLMPAGRVLVGALPSGLRQSVAAAIADRTAYSTEAVLRELSQFSYWSSSRILEGTINEFPLFGWLNGDLHAHMMSPGFLLLAVALSFAYFHAPAGARWRRRGLVALVAAVGGLVAVVNTWSFATVYGVLWLALVFAPTDPVALFPWGGRLPTPRSLVGEELRRVVGAGVIAAVAAVAGIALAAPFWLRAGSGRGIGLLPDRSSVAALVLVHGAFLAVTVGHLLVRARPVVPAGRLAGTVAGTLLLGAAAWVVGFGPVAVFGPVLVGGWLLARARARAREPGRGPGGGRAGRPTATDGGDSGPSFATVLVVGAVGLALLVEFVYVKETPAADRYNTVFKTYAQVWALWATAAGAMLAGLARRGPALALSVPDWVPALTPGARARTVTLRLGQVFAVVLVASTSVYAGLAVADHVETFEEEPFCVFPEEATLDALAFVDDCHPGEAGAIAWIDAREGTPTVAAAPGQSYYQWVNPESSLTGVPTVAGWGHEVGYRNLSVYNARVDDLEGLFEGDPATQVRMLRRYDVQYVYVGPRERARYADLSFDRVTGVDVATTRGNVTIYAVDHGALGVRDGNESTTSAIATSGTVG